jgi:hypothetical protein
MGSRLAAARASFNRIEAGFAVRLEVPLINATDWGLERESSISATSCAEIVGSYDPLENGFDDQAIDVEPKPVFFDR